jgi:molybdopterin/thiamine biosynthesis adenylyltransferase
MRLDYWRTCLTLSTTNCMQLDNDEIRRYSRHLILPEVGLAGQKKICSTSVVCIGAGGLGSPIAMYLAAAGIGKIGIVDFDTVDFSNLAAPNHPRHRGRGPPKSNPPKTPSTASTRTSKSSCTTRAITSENALDILAQYDIVVDGTDNFPTRYLTNDACVLLKKPNVYGSIFRFEGQASVFAPHLNGPCYRCLVSRTASARHGAQLRGRRRARRFARHHRLHSSHRNFETGPGQRQFAHWPPAAFQRAGNEIPRTPAPPRSAMPACAARIPPSPS